MTAFLYCEYLNRYYGKQWNLSTIHVLLYDIRNFNIYFYHKITAKHAEEEKCVWKDFHHRQKEELHALPAYWKDELLLQIYFYYIAAFDITTYIHLAAFLVRVRTSRFRYILWHADPFVGGNCTAGVASRCPMLSAALSNNWTATDVICA
jgi:hypothetical protein